MKTIDKNRFKEVFKEYYNPLCNFASSIVHDSKLAQDVVQDVFTKMWDKRKALNIESSEKSYLFSAVKNRALEELRRQKVAKTASQVSRLQESDSYSAEEEANNYMLKERLYQSIRKLPPKCQEVFVLNKVNGLTYNEIAADLNISVKTVENHIGKAYRLLRNLMEDKLTTIN